MCTDIKLSDFLFLGNRIDVVSVVLACRDDLASRNAASVRLKRHGKHIELDLCRGTNGRGHPTSVLSLSCALAKAQLLSLMSDVIVERGKNCDLVERLISDYLVSV